MCFSIVFSRYYDWWGPSLRRQWEEWISDCIKENGHKSQWIPSQQPPKSLWMKWLCNLRKSTNGLACWFGGFGGLDFLDPRKWKGLLLHGNLRIPNQGTFHIGKPGNDPKNQHQNPRNWTMISKPNKSLTTRPQMAKSNPSETMTLIHMAIMSCILSFAWDVRNWHHLCYNCKEMFWILTCALFAGISYSSQSNARIYSKN